MAARAKTERAPGADETAEKATPRDPRAEALRGLQEQVTARREQAGGGDPEFGGDPVPAGGGVKVGVLFDHYTVRVDGVWRSFERGAVLSVSGEDADRGEAIGGLRRL